jgi:hypothetical protein
VDKLFFSTACLTTPEKFGGDCTPAPDPDGLCWNWLTACCILLNPPNLDVACFIFWKTAAANFERLRAGLTFVAKNKFDIKPGQYSQTLKWQFRNGNFNNSIFYQYMSFMKF